jgi:hypothetical protein
MKCESKLDNVSQCYLTPNMKEVRANLLLYTKQYDRLNDLRTQLNRKGFDLNMSNETRKLIIINLKIQLFY